MLPLWKSKKDSNGGFPTVLSLCTSNPQMADIYISSIASVLGPGRYPTILWGAVFWRAFDVNTRKTHSLACSCTTPPLSFSSHPSPHCLVTPVFPLAGKIKTLTDKTGEMFCCISRQSVWRKNLWKLSPDLTVGVMWSELICQEATVF